MPGEPQYCEYTVINLDNGHQSEEVIEKHEPLGKYGRNIFVIKRRDV